MVSVEKRPRIDVSSGLSQGPSFPSGSEIWERGRQDFRSWLISCNSNVSYIARDDDRNTIIHLSAFNNRYDIINESLRHLKSRCNESREHIIDLLMRKNRYGQTAIMIAQAKNHTESIRTMLAFLSKQERLKLLKQGDDKGQTFLHRLITDNGEEQAASMAKLLEKIARLMEPADWCRLLKATDHSNCTAIHYASEKSYYVDAIRVMLSKVPDQRDRVTILQIGDSSGYTALHVAVEELNDACIDCIIDFISEKQDRVEILKLRDEANKTVMDYALDGEKEGVPCVNALLRAVGASDYDGYLKETGKLRDTGPSSESNQECSNGMDDQKPIQKTRPLGYDVEQLTKEVMLLRDECKWHKEQTTCAEREYSTLTKTHAELRERMEDSLLENDKLKATVARLEAQIEVQRSESGSCTGSDEEDQPLNQIPDLPPKQTEIVERLQTLCEKLHRTDDKVLINPDNPRNIVIYGPNVEESEVANHLPAIKSEDESWSCYDVEVKNKRHVTRSSPVQFAGLKRFRLPRREERTGVCQLIVKMTDPVNGKETKFAVTAGHILFNDEDNRLLRHGANIEPFRRMLKEPQHGEESVYQLLFTGIPGIEPIDDDYELLFPHHPVYFGYRSTILGGTRNYERCLNDVALLSLTSKKALDLQCKLQRDTLRKEKIMNIEGIEELERYITGSNIAISIRGMEGRLVANMQRGNNAPHHLLFRLNDDRNTLQRGQSGSILFELRRISNGQVRKRPLGLFVGSPDADHLFEHEGLYQAVILCHVLHDIAIAYRHEIALNYRGDFDKFFQAYRPAPVRQPQPPGARPPVRQPQPPGA